MRTRHDAGDHLCAVEGCSRRIPLELLMCREDWERVPRAQRTDVNVAYRRWRAHPGPDTIQQLLVARTAALTALRAIRA